MTIFAIPINVQDEQVKKYCFGLCGKALPGFHSLQGITCTFCREVECPALDRQMTTPEWVVDGEQVYLRALVEDPLSKEVSA